MSQGQALLLAVGGLAAWALIFVVWWMLVGYGTSIAVRTYRWCMRGHDRRREIERLDREIKELV